MSIAAARAIRALAVAVVGVVGIIAASPHLLVVKDQRANRSEVSVEVMTHDHARRSISCVHREIGRLCGFWGGTLAGGYFVETGDSRTQEHSCYFGWLVPSLNVVTIASNGQATCR